MSEYEAEARAIREKTARLKALRLAKDAGRTAAAQAGRAEADTPREIALIFRDRYYRTSSVCGAFSTP